MDTACPHCSGTHIVHNGFIRNVRRWLYRDCNRTFTRTTPRGQPVASKALAVLLYTHGLSLSAIGKIVEVSTVTVLRWVREFAREHYAKPVPDGKMVIIEIDEMWHYLKKKLCPVLIWKAVCRTSGRLLDWEIGDRSAATLQRLIDRLSKWPVVVYCGDHWDAYAAVIPEVQLIQSKTVTDTVERNNCLQRQWFKRFGRKSIMVSKSLEMIDLTMALFALLHVNGNADSLISLL